MSNCDSHNLELKARTWCKPFLFSEVVAGFLSCLCFLNCSVYRAEQLGGASRGEAGHRGEEGVALLCCRCSWCGKSP